MMTHIFKVLKVFKDKNDYTYIQSFENIQR